MASATLDHMIFDEYAPPLTDKLLYWLAHQINLYGEGDVDEMVQEARILIWRMWQETQWVRGMPPKPASCYTKAAQRRMRAICYRKVTTFGGAGRQGYSDVLNHADGFLDAENFPEPCTEIPFELLDRIPGTLLGALVLPSMNFQNVTLH